jgi:hypothetical protein
MSGGERFGIGVIACCCLTLAAILLFAQVVVIVEAVNGNWNPVIGEAVLVGGTALFSAFAWVVGGVLGDDTR